MIGNTADETNIPNKSLLTDKQASKLLKDYTMIYLLIWIHQKHTFLKQHN